LFGATAGQGVVWYTGQFYAMTFIERTCQVNSIQTWNIIAIALLIGTPLFIYFGWLSDRIGRKMIMMAGMLLAVILYRPIYGQMYALADVKESAVVGEPLVIHSGLSVTDNRDSVSVTKTETSYANGNRQVETVTTTRAGNAGEGTVTKKTEIVLSREHMMLMILFVFIQVVFVAMVYGPIAAFLVELFPTKIRYTSMSLPYHIGNGIFGGLTPFIATSLYVASQTDANPDGDPFAGLYYPITVAAICFVIGMIFLSNKKKGDVMHEL
jgi:MHS family proline/betaine transporter-like MFS transporter